MKIYVAAASLERNERARPVMEALEKAGHTITHDWTLSVDMFRHPDDCTRRQLEMCALDDYHGVANAEALLLLAPTRPSTGAWAELGIGLVFCERVIVAGPCECIFVHHPRVERFDTDADAVRELGGAL